MDESSATVLAEKTLAFLAEPRLVDLTSLRDNDGDEDVADALEPFIPYYGLDEFLLNNVRVRIIAFRTLGAWFDKNQGLSPIWYFQPKSLRKMRTTAYACSVWRLFWLPLRVLRIPRLLGTRSPRFLNFFLARPPFRRFCRKNSLLGNLCRKRRLV